MKPPVSGKESQLTRAQLFAENHKLRREIDHRVRNTLQMVGSLVDVTSRTSVEPSALAVLDILRARISAMIAVYRTLDDAPHRANVNMDETLRDLVDQIAGNRSNGAPMNDARIQAKGVSLPLDDAMPVAQMVIEVLLSSVLHLDIGSMGPYVTVDLTRNGDEALLRIYLVNAADDSVMPKLSANALQMMEVLARQLGGPLLIDNDDGITRTIEVRFPVRDRRKTQD